jgi:putative phage-type endonuclease
MPGFKPISIPVKSDHHLHELRAQNVGASEIAALFGASPYTTLFTLWYQKAGKILSPDFDSERMYWGNRLEPVIAQGIAEKQGWTIRKVRRYLMHPTVKGMGATLDYEIFNHADGPACLEIKNLSIEAWRKNWLKNEDGSIEAPLHIELQLQHQLSVTGRPWGAIGFLVGGNKGHVVIRKRHEPTIQKIEQAIAAFWDTIEKGKAPELEEAGDLGALVQLFDGSQTVTLDSDEFESRVQACLDAEVSEKAAKEHRKTANAHLIALLNKHGAEIALGRGLKATYKLQTRSSHFVKASEFRVLRVSELADKAEREDV